MRQGNEQPLFFEPLQVKLDGLLNKLQDLQLRLTCSNATKQASLISTWAEAVWHNLA